MSESWIKPRPLPESDQWEETPLPLDDESEEPNGQDATDNRD